MIEKPILAIIVPCYNEEEVVNATYSALFDVLKQLAESKKIATNSYICFVDDGSKDKTWEIITKLSKENDLIKGLKLSRNFGHQAAIIAGLTKSEADIFITIDADLQDDVNTIYQMVDKYLEGFEIVYGVRNDRSSDGFFKRHISEFYYKLSTYLGVNGIYNHADFRLMSKKVVDILKNLQECNIYLRGLIPSLGFKSCSVYFSRKKRVAGTAKYNFFSSSALAIDGITSFSTTPLRLITILGFICFCIAVLMSIFSIISYIYLKNVQGWASLFISVYFLGGIQLLSVGIIGEYIGKIYKETKQRPKFLVEERIE
ncbi:MAG: glycosyltransferase family 2 protein [bacterium]